VPNPDTKLTIVVFSIKTMGTLWKANRTSDGSSGTAIYS